MKGSPFEERKVRPTKPPKPTVEEVPDEEPQPVTNPDAEPIGPQDYPLEDKPVLSRKHPNHLNPSLNPKQK